MLYRKPELVKLAPAIQSIQGENKEIAQPHDSDPSNVKRVTTGAYEADE